MMNAMEEKLILHGDTQLKLIRVLESGMNNRVFGNILISIKHYREAAQEIFSVRITPLSPSAIGMVTNTGNGSMADKLSINKFEAFINHSDMLIHLGPVQGVHIEDTLKDHGIGAYALTQLITHLRQSCPNYTIAPYEMALTDDPGDEKKEALAAFLAKFNIALTFADFEQRVAIIRAGTPAQLTTYYNTEKIQELDLEEYIFQLLNERIKNESSLSQMKAEMTRNNMDNTPITNLPAKQLVKYTLIGCGLAVLLILVLIL